MPSQLLKLKHETLAILMVDGHRIAEPIPAGTVVTVFAGALEEPHQLVEVQWEGRTAQMFAEDLRQRGISMQAATRQGVERSNTEINENFSTHATRRALDN